MKHSFTIRRASLVLFALFLAACAGTKARQHVLWPQVKATWPAVMEDIDKSTGGVGLSRSAASSIDQIEKSIESDDHTQLLGLNWVVLEKLASLGVQARVEGGLSPGVASSLSERNKNFWDSVKELTKR